jgi:hypothetical protein
MHWLHRLIVAIHFVITLRAGGGVRLISEVLELSGLSAFVGASYGSQQALAAAGEGLPITLVQGTSEEATALRRHIERDHQAHHFPDLFHLQHEVAKATGLALARARREADAEAPLQAERAAEQAYHPQRHGPGRPPAFAQRRCSHHGARLSIRARPWRRASVLSSSRSRATVPICSSAQAPPSRGATASSHSSTTVAIDSVRVSSPP